MPDQTADLIIHSIGELATARDGSAPAKGKEMSDLLRLKKAALAIKDGKILAIGTESAVKAEIKTASTTEYIDAGGALVTPGFIDPHTHLIFAGNRASEFLMRCQGKTYQQIAEAGGGIVASMRATRDASVEQLVLLAQPRLKHMLASGTTTAEVKTGYGLSNESELNMLEAIFRLRSLQKVELIPTFMPAHAFPPDLDREKYLHEIIENMIPNAVSLAKRYQNGQGLTIFQDVFCDKGYFSVQESKRLLLAGMEHGLRPKIHADEFENMGGSTLAVELGAASADHLLNISDQEISLMAKSTTVAVLLPGTSFFLNLKEHARARFMIENGMALALGSDFNPGSCHIYSLPFIFGLSCLHLKMSCEESLTALTRNAAHAVGLGTSHGVLAPGKAADFLILNVSALEEIPYNLGSNPVHQIYKHGQLVHQNN